MVAGPLRPQGGDQPQPFLIDAFDPRFWIVYSSGRTPTVNRVHGDLLQQPGVDWAWLPPSLLHHTPCRHWQRLGLRVYFDNRALLYGATPSGEHAADPEPAEEWDDQELDASAELADGEGMFVAVEMNASRAVQRAMHLFAGDGVQEGTLPFEHSLFSSSPGRNGDRVRARVYRTGRFVATGAPAGEFDAFLQAWYHAYRDRIQRIESSFRYDPSGRGNPINISFSRPVPDLCTYLRGLFSCGQPLRLWGVPEVIGGRFARVHAIDLHTRAPLYMEIGLAFIRLYLGPDTCGNTVARLYSAILQRQDRGAEVYGADRGEPLL
jgi:hypothetical protein